MNNCIDFVIIWVDGNDPKWLNEFKKYKKEEDVDVREIRFRDWDNLQYWFRGVEKFAPWVRKIHFVTCGHYPSWLNLNNPKLNLVKHSDYIPIEYLPTFSANPIELNLHRINGLAEKFVFFNDDIFLINHVKETDFFQNNLPCDIAVLEDIPKNGIYDIIINDLDIINKNFNITSVLIFNFKKWYTSKYGKCNLKKTLSLSLSKKFTGIQNPHMPNPFLKETFIEVWKKEYEELDKTCKNRFRSNKDLNQYLMRYWQLAKGNFYPKNTTLDFIGFSITDDTRSISDIIQNQKKKQILLNDDGVIDFEKTKNELKSIFESILPNKSSFEI